MPVIAVVNQKGGVGKTCLATNVASVLGSDEPAVLLLDCDPQRSAVGWVLGGPPTGFASDGTGCGSGSAGPPGESNCRGIPLDYHRIVRRASPA